jgi:3-deoxy-alpha-D-manno-octulosonate 8-oxidase
MHKNFKNIEQTVYGRGSFDMMDEILSVKRNQHDRFFVFLVDNYFNDKPLASRIPARQEDLIRFIDVDPAEPTTEQIDNLRDDILSGAEA